MMGDGQQSGGGWGIYDEVKSYTFYTRLKGVLIEI